MSNDLETLLGSTTGSEGQLSELTLLVDEAGDLRSQVVDFEDALKAIKSELHQLEQTRIPAAMAACGLASFKTANGYSCAIKDFVSGSLPKVEELREAALRWIDEAGAGDIIKRAISINLGRDSDHEANVIEDFLKEQSVEFHSNLGVHPMTLAAFARERMANGEEVPLDLLGLFAGRSAKIDLPKKGK